MQAKNYDSLEEAMVISASRDVVRIQFLHTNPVVQLNLGIDLAKALVMRLQVTIEAAELLSRLDKEGR